MAPSSKKPRAKKADTAFALTRETYYDPRRLHISNSHVSDFLKSRAYYYKKHIAKTMKPKVSVPMKIGRIVDSCITGEKIPYDVKVLKRDDPDLFEAQKDMPDDVFVSRDQMETARGLANAIKGAEFFKEYCNRRTEFQFLLSGNIDKTLICGLADIVSYDAETTTFYIDDIKTSAAYAVKSPTKWFFHAQDFGYCRQLAAYRMMLREINAPLANAELKIVCRHIVASKIEDDLYQVKLFILSDAVLDQAEREFIAGVRAIQDAMDKNKWEDEPLTWNKAEELKGWEDETMSADAWDDEFGEEAEDV